MIKRLELGEEKYKEYHKAKKADRGKDSRQFKHEVELKIAQEKQLLSHTHRVREAEERAARQAYQQRIAEEMQSEALQMDISNKQQNLTELKNNIEQDFSKYKKLSIYSQKMTFLIKIKSESERDKIKNRVNAEVRSRDELNAELDSLLDDIMRNETKEKQRSF